MNTLYLGNEPLYQKTFWAFTQSELEVLFKKWEKKEKPLIIKCVAFINEGYNCEVRVAYIK